MWPAFGLIKTGEEEGLWDREGVLGWGVFVRSFGLVAVSI
jgi:hypothetical protein